MKRKLCSVIYVQKKWHNLCLKILKVIKNMLFLFVDKSEPDNSSLFQNFDPGLRD